MTELILQIVAIIFTLLGLGLTLIGAIGVLRMPDIYHRLHASSKCATLGLIGLLIGVACHLSNYPGGGALVIKAVITVLFAFIALPTGSHVLAKAAWKDRARQWEGTLDDELARDRSGA
jgi:multicomponent Na+:H+ antiporter subunit G